ncbi:serine hydrolase [Streptococcus iniae]
MKKIREIRKDRLITGICLLLGLVGFIQTAKVTDHKGQRQKNKTNQVKKVREPAKVLLPKTRQKEKSQLAKEAVMQEDFARMNELGLYYDYANLSLVDTVKAYLKEFSISEDQIAFSYKDLESGKTFSMNDTQPMTAGSTYKLPLNMLVVDDLAKGKFTMDERFDITQTTYEYENEHLAYVGQFSGAMSIPEMQEYSLLYSENTPAYALAERVGGLDKAFQKMSKYGQSKADIKTIQRQGNKTTSDYYLQVLDYLWTKQEKYKDLLYYIGESFPNQYYKTYLPDLIIYQKPGYVGEALNVDAIVLEESPYLIALYTAYLGGSTEQSEEISSLGYNQLVALTYVINQWHRVNHNSESKKETS